MGSVTRFWILPTAILAAAIVAAGATLVLGRPAPGQPIAFNHRVHTEELGMDCTDCHQHVLSGQRATIPNIAVCADCHEEAQTESPDEALLVESIGKQELIPWVRVTWVPSDVYFSHRRHAALGEISCATCHGEVEGREQPLTRPLVRLTMDGCIECHERQGVTTDCVSCHR